MTGSDGRAALNIVRTAFDAFSRRDLGAFSNLAHPDMELLGPTAQIAHGGVPYRGFDGLQRYFEDVGRVWKSLRVVPQRYWAEPDRLLVLGRVFARDARGGIADLPAGWVWTMKEGRIASVRIYEGHVEALEVFGLQDAVLEPFDRS